MRPTGRHRIRHEVAQQISREQLNTSKKRTRQPTGRRLPNVAPWRARRAVKKRAGRQGQWQARSAFIKRSQSPNGRGRAGTAQDVTERVRSRTPMPQASKSTDIRWSVLYQNPLVSTDCRCPIQHITISCRYESGSVPLEFSGTKTKKKQLQRSC